ncbi:putative chaoptin [Penaeus vannamei]|uniref:Putative chaoptin n=1 Tax=Penaeus vannamei TaxID=6689 RepID=A0A423SEH9_PENVA|nr:putative chaoptin [Penaeus vannamei]
MDWLYFTTLLAAWTAGGSSLTRAQEVSRTACPSWEDNPWCPCYHFDDGVFLECPMVSLNKVSRVLGLVQRAVKSLSIYDLDANVTKLPPGLFTSSAGVSSLQISHSGLQTISDGSFQGLENTLESLTIMHSQLTAVPQAALQTLTRLRALDLEANNITELQSFSFFKLKLVSLNLKGNGIKLISEYAFDGLHETLEELNLMNNKLKQLPIPALRRLSKLRTLKATWNRISDVINDGYSRLPALEVLDLSSNHFTQLTSSTLGTMPVLLSLSMYMNEISLLSGDAFVQNTRLQTLYLSHNDITNVEPETFTYTIYIRVIDLGDNHLHSISNGMFRNLPEIQEIFLNNNNILKIKNDTFTNSTKITVLYLQNNEIHSIESGAFANLELLFDLQLSSNNLVQIPVGLFSTTRSLSSLSLDNNRLTSLNKGTFAHLAELRELRLQNNRLTRIERLTMLERLNMDDNEIMDIEPQTFQKLPNLTTLDLSNNQIFVIRRYMFEGSIPLRTLNLKGSMINEIDPDAFADLRFLEELNLKKNMLVSLHKLYFRTPSIRNLNLADNHFDTVAEDSLYDLPNLDTLDLSGCRLENLPAHLLAEASELRTLNLARNNLPPGVFANLSITRLNLADNIFSQIPNAMFLDGMASLRTLNMSGNPMKRVTGILVAGGPPLAALEELEASRTNLTVLTSHDLLLTPSLRSLNLGQASIAKISPGCFRNLTQLTHLNLGFNHLEILPRERLRGLKSLSHLNLTGNSLKKLDQLPSDSHMLKASILWVLSF